MEVDGYLTVSEPLGLSSQYAYSGYFVEEGALFKPRYSEWLYPAKPNSNGYKREPIAFFEILTKDSES